MKFTGILNFLTTILIVICYYLKPVDAQGGCPPTKEAMKPLMDNLKSWYEPIKKLKPGINPKDVDFIIYKLAKDVFLSNRWKPCNEFTPEWPDIEKDAIHSRKECYHPTDLSKESAQKEFKDCMTKLIPPMAMKYGGQSIELCECFANKFLPKYETKYKKLIKSYFDEFKTLKHRKK